MSVFASVCIYVLLGAAVACILDDRFNYPGATLSHPFDWLSTAGVVLAAMVWPLALFLFLVPKKA